MAFSAFVLAFWQRSKKKADGGWAGASTGGPVTSQCCEKSGKVCSLKCGAESSFPHLTRVVCPSRRQQAPGEPLTQCLHVHPSKKEFRSLSAKYCFLQSLGCPSKLKPFVSVKCSPAVAHSTVNSRRSLHSCRLMSPSGACPALCLLEVTAVSHPLPRPISRILFPVLLPPPICSLFTELTRASKAAHCLGYWFPCV